MFFVRFLRKSAKYIVNYEVSGGHLSAAGAPPSSGPARPGAPGRGRGGVVTIEDSCIEWSSAVGTRNCVTGSADSVSVDLEIHEKISRILRKS